MKALEIRYKQAIIDYLGLTEYPLLLRVKRISISTDTRSFKKGQIFVALVGEKFDAHDFIAEILPKACLVISEYSLEDLKAKYQDQAEVFDKYASRLAKVDDSLLAYQEIATIYRELVNPLTIGITGSSGKTTTKELLDLALKTQFKTHKSVANHNNELGVPQTILNMPIDTEVLILEMGMRGTGQIDELSKIAKPNLCLITCIGSAHIEILGSREAIRNAKLEIINHIEAFAKDTYALKYQYTEDILDKFIPAPKVESVESEKIMQMAAKAPPASQVTASSAPLAVETENTESEETFDKSPWLDFDPGKLKPNLIDDLPNTLIIDDELLNELAEMSFINPNTNSEFDIENILFFGSEEIFEFPGLYNSGIISDINACYQVAKLLGVKREQFQEAILEYEPLDGRGGLYRDINNNIFIDDTYNANPEALEANIQSFIRDYPQKSIIFIFGTIEESDDDLIEKAIDKLYNHIEKYETYEFLDARAKTLIDVKDFLEKDLKLELAKLNIEKVPFKLSKQAIKEASMVIYLKASNSFGLNRVLFDVAALQKASKELAALKESLELKDYKPPAKSSSKPAGSLKSKLEAELAAEEKAAEEGMKKPFKKGNRTPPVMKKTEPPKKK